MSDIHPIVKQIIDRDCHVWMSGREVVRHVISKLREGFRTFRALSRADRRQLVSDCLEHHRVNCQLYVDVMSGLKTNDTSSAQTAKPIAWPHVMSTGRLTGPMMRRFMRQQRVTIRELAARTSITQKRIRELREVGINDPGTVRDMLQAIAGVDPGLIPLR